MSSSVISKCLLYALIVYTATTEYVVDVIDIEWNVTTTNNCEMSWEVSQPTRGTFVINGIWDIKEDIDTEKNNVKIDVYYSKNDITYTLTPYRVPPLSFTNYINDIYPRFLKNITTKCCENPIEFSGKFIPPLTKRRMLCKDCMLSTDNLPTHLRPGFYRMTGVSAGEFAFMLSITAKLDYE